MDENIPINPVAIFAFNRPWHLNKTLESLKNSKLATETEVTIFIDGPRFERERRKVLNVESIANSYGSFFKRLLVITKKKNTGCASSLLNGVTQMLQKHESVIVLEDDIIVGKNFLTYMNMALNLYKEQKDIFHINGFNYSLDTSNIINSKIKCFLLRSMFCWGWATWRDRWIPMIEDPLCTDAFHLINTVKKADRKRFNLDGVSDWWAQVEANAFGKLDTWAIFWFAFIFNNNGLCLTPCESLTYNIGMDGSGEHCEKLSEIRAKLENDQEISIFPEEIIEDLGMLRLLKDYFKHNSLLNKVKRIYLVPLKLIKRIRLFLK